MRYQSKKTLQVSTLPINDKLRTNTRYVSTTINGLDVNEKGPLFEVDVEQKFRHFPA